MPRGPDTDLLERQKFFQDFMNLEYFTGVLSSDARAQRRAMLFARAERMMEALEWRTEWTKDGCCVLKDQDRKQLERLEAPVAPTGISRTSWQRLVGTFQAIKIFQNQGLL